MKALVTGATGFVGQALVRRLQAMGAEVIGLGRNRLRLTQLESQGVRALYTDLADAQAIHSVCQGQEVVFHVAAFSSPWGQAQDFYRSNVIATQNVIHACEEGGVKRLVHVSTPGIYFRYESRLDVREDEPLPGQVVNEYTRTKLLAEGEIDRAFARGLPVITIRPRAIFGPGDTSILPRLVDRLEKGRLRVIGDGKNITDLTYIENVVDALLLCATSPQTTLGKKYNITNGTPVKMWEMIEKLCQALGYEFPRRSISYNSALAAATFLEIIYALLPGNPEPPFTRYVVGLLAKSTTLDISAARQELGYQPRVSNEEGFAEFVRWWKDTHP
jgi:nucleoside-diphosphate-sugar epimerase